MSNLSFARIMYGATQENPASALMPVSNRPSNLSSAPSPISSASSTTVANLLHKAWLVLTRHN